MAFELLFLGEAGLFILGIVYAVLLGNSQMPVANRAIKGGVFFAFFYFWLPMIWFFGIGFEDWVDPCDLGERRD